MDSEQPKQSWKGGTKLEDSHSPISKLNTKQTPERKGRYEALEWNWELTNEPLHSWTTGFDKGAKMTPWGKKSPVNKYSLLVCLLGWLNIHAQKEEAGSLTS